MQELTLTFEDEGEQAFLGTGEADKRLQFYQRRGQYFCIDTRRPDQTTMNTIESIPEPITHAKYRAFVDDIGNQIKDAAEVNARCQRELIAFCEEARLVIADAHKKFHELKHEMDAE